MKKIAFLLAICCWCGTALGQTVIKPEEASKHVGEKVSVCGKIYGGRFFENGKNQPTLLNMGDKFPNNPLTVVIYGELRAKLGYKPEEKFLDKELCVTGTITLFKEKPQIVIEEAAQLQPKEGSGQ
jgi:hypothetical protein